MRKWSLDKNLKKIKINKPSVCFQVSLEASSRSRSGWQTVRGETQPRSLGFPGLSPGHGTNIPACNAQELQLAESFFHFGEEMENARVPSHARPSVHLFFQ